MKTITVWTIGYRPFVMGGSVYYPVGCKVQVTDKPKSLGKGFAGYLVTAPNGKTFVAESTTGAFVGPTIEKVKADIKACKDKSMMAQQVADAKEKLEKLELVEPAKFWSLLKCA